MIIGYPDANSSQQSNSETKGMRIGTKGSKSEGVDVDKMRFIKGARRIRSLRNWRIEVGWKGAAGGEGRWRGGVMGMMRMKVSWGLLTPESNGLAELYAPISNDVRQQL